MGLGGEWWGVEVHGGGYPVVRGRWCQDERGRYLDQERWNRGGISQEAFSVARKGREK